MDFFAFMYELRRQDDKDKYTFNLLNGHIKPNIIINIIMANVWDSRFNKMVPSSENVNSFRLLIGKKQLRDVK